MKSLPVLLRWALIYRAWKSSHWQSSPDVQLNLTLPAPGSASTTLASHILLNPDLYILFRWRRPGLAMGHMTCVASQGLVLPLMLSALAIFKFLIVLNKGLHIFISHWDSQVMLLVLILWNSHQPPLLSSSTPTHPLTSYSSFRDAQTLATDSLSGVSSLSPV